MRRHRHRQEPPHLKAAVAAYVVTTAVVAAFAAIAGVLHVLP